MAERGTPAEFTSRGQQQIDRLFIGRADVRVDDPSVDFLKRLGSLNEQLGTIVAGRFREERAEQNKELEEYARLKATNPAEWQRRLASGEVQETDHPIFRRAFEVYDAQATATQAAEDFSAFDVTATDDRQLNEFVDTKRKAYLQRNQSVIYQGAMSGRLMELEADLRARRSRVVGEQAKDVAYTNFGASIAGTVAEALKTGRSSELPPVLALQLARGVAAGMSHPKLLAQIAQPLLAAVKQDPSLADVLGGMQIAGLSRPLSDYFPGDFEAAAAAGEASQRALARAAITLRRAQERQTVSDVKADAARSIADGRQLDDEQLQRLRRWAPEYLLKLPKLIETQSDAMLELSPDYRRLGSDVTLGKDGSRQEDVDALLSADAIGVRQHAKLTKMADSAKERGDLTKSPDYKFHLASVTRTFDNTLAGLTAPAEGGATGKLAGLPGFGGRAAKMAADVRYDAEESRTRVLEFYREASAANPDDPKAFAGAAKEAREMALLELNTLSQFHGLGGNEEVPGGPAAEVLASQPKVKVPPVVIRTANEELAESGIRALHRIGGFFSLSGDPQAQIQVGLALGSLATGGPATPWLQSRYQEFAGANPDLDLSVEEYLLALHYASLPVKAAPTTGSPGERAPSE